MLFIIYINDFSQANSIHRFIIYVDYTIVFSIFTTFSSFTNELPNIFEWLNITELSLNKTKSTYMIGYALSKCRYQFKYKLLYYGMGML